MITIKVTEEEYRKIMNSRNKKRISKKEIEEKITAWIESIEQIEKTTFELYQLYDTNAEASHFIRKNIDYDLLYDLYKLLDDEKM